MTDPTTGAWHPDPTGRHQHRWWDGTRWTDQVADGGVAGTDPVNMGPASADPVSTQPVPTVTPSPGGSRRRRPNLKVIAAVVVLIVVGIVAAILLTRSDGTSRDDAIDVCRESGSDRSECECLVDEHVDAGGSLDEFVDATEGGLADPEDVPEALVDAFLECLTR